MKIRAIYILFFFVQCVFAHVGYSQYTKVERELDRTSLIDLRNATNKAKESNNHLKQVDTRGLLADREYHKVNLSGRLATYKSKAEGSLLYKQTKESTLIVVSSIMHATAFAIDASGICVSNYHVLQSFGDTTLSKNDVLFVQTSEGKLYPVTEILSSSKINDIVIFKVDLGGDKLVPLPLGDIALEGSDIYMMGHPSFIRYFFTKGIVSKNFVRSREPRDGDDFRMAVTTEYSVGASGGPIIDDKGNVVGVVCTAVTLYADNEKKVNPQIVLKAAIPVIAIKQLLL